MFIIVSTSFIFLGGGLSSLRDLYLAFLSSKPLMSYILITNQISMIVIWGYAISTLCYIVRKQHLKLFGVLFLYSVFLFLLLVQMFLKSNFNMRISPMTFMLIGETTPEEAKGFFSAFLFSPNSVNVYILVLVVLVLIVLFEWKRRQISHFFSHKANMLVKVIVCMICVFIPYNMFALVRLFSLNNVDAIVSWQGHYNFKDPVSRCIYSLYSNSCTQGELSHAIEINKLSLKENTFLLNDDSLDVILVIGESYIKRHANLYGYDLQTTPFLSKEQKSGNLIVFSDVISPYNLTSNAIRNIISCNSLSRHETWSNSPLVMPLFKKAGYDVLYWDNQHYFDTDAGYALNSLFYNPDIANISYTATNKEIFWHDGRLVEDFAKTQLNPSAKQLVMIHLMGQHFDAVDRYPHSNEFEVFTADSILSDGRNYITAKMRKEIAEYDNATLYNDKVMKEIINLFRNKTAVLVYLSDHGETIYDFSPQKGRMNFEDSPYKHQIIEYQYRVPFMIWCSDSYISKYPKSVDMMRNAIDKPFCTEDIPHLLFHLAGIQTTFYKEDRNLISPNYKPVHRLIEAIYDYDGNK